VADTGDDVSLLFADIVGFTSMSSAVTPEQLVAFLSDLYTAFDELTDACGITKVETIGDCYWCCSDVLNPDPNHIEIMADYAEAMLERLKTLKPPGNSDVKLQLRVGLHVGKVLGGVVGTSMPRYHLFGQQINIAQLMESSGVPGRVNASQQFARRLSPFKFEIEPRESLQSPEFGDLPMYLIRRRTATSNHHHELIAATTPPALRNCEPSQRSSPGHHKGATA